MPGGIFAEWRLRHRHGQRGWNLHAQSARPIHARRMAN